MAASPWTDLYRSLPNAAKLAVVGGAAVGASMILPWYGIAYLRLSQTGFDSFGAGQIALLVTAGAVLYVIVRCARGYRPPRPLGEGTLVVAGGAWATGVVGYLMLDRPDKIAGFSNIHLRYGIFVALGGAIAMLVGGLRLRREESAEPPGP